MVDFIKYDPGPTLGENLGKALGGGLQSLSEQFLKSISPEAKEKRAKARILENFKFSDQTDQGQEGSSFSNLSPEQIESITFSMTSDPAKAAEAGRRAREENYKIGERAQKQERSQDIFDRYVDLIKEGRTGLTFKGATDMGRAQRAEMRVLGEQMISQYKDLVAKGQFPQARFDYIKTLVPSPWDTDAKVIGKLQAMSKELGINPSSLKNYRKEIGFEDPSLRKKDEPQLESKKLTGDLVEEFIEKAPGATKEQRIKNAKRLAESQGYRF